MMEKKEATMAAGSQYRMVIDDPSKIGLLTEDMKKLVIRGAAQTVNIQAVLTRKNAVKILKGEFTLRNSFTTGGINLHFDRADEDARSFGEVSSTVGAVRQYMERQEEGGIHADPGGGKLAIPTDEARGGDNKKPVPRSMYIKKVRRKMYEYNPAQRKGTPGSNLVAVAATAFKEGAFLKYGENIYRVTDFRSGGGDVEFDLEMVYFRQLSQTETKAHPWLEPAMRKPAADRQRIFNSQMNKLDR